MTGSSCTAVGFEIQTHRRTEAQCFCASESFSSIKKKPDNCTKKDLRFILSIFWVCCLKIIENDTIKQCYKTECKFDVGNILVIFALIHLQSCICVCLLVVLAELGYCCTMFPWQPDRCNQMDKHSSKQMS